MTFKVRENKYYHLVYDKHCFHETKAYKPHVPPKITMVGGHGQWHPDNGEVRHVVPAAVCCQCAKYKGNRGEHGQLAEDEKCVAPLEDRVDSKSYFE